MLFRAPAPLERSLLSTIDKVFTPAQLCAQAPNLDKCHYLCCNITFTEHQQGSFIFMTIPSSLHLNRTGPLPVLCKQEDARTNGNSLGNKRVSKKLQSSQTCTHQTLLEDRIERNGTNSEAFNLLEVFAVKSAGVFIMYKPFFLKIPVNLSLTWQSRKPCVECSSHYGSNTQGKVFQSF